MSLGLFFSLQSKLSSPRPAAGTAQCPEVAQCHSPQTALGGWDPQLFAGHLPKGESRVPMGYRLMENQPWVGKVPQLIPLLLWGVQALMRRGMRGSPKGQIQGLRHLSRGRAEQRTTPVPSLSRGGRKVQMGRGADAGWESPLAPRLRCCSLQHLDKPAPLLESDLCKMSFEVPGPHPEVPGGTGWFNSITEIEPPDPFSLCCPARGGELGG